MGFLATTKSKLCKWPVSEECKGDDTNERNSFVSSEERKNPEGM